MPPDSIKTCPSQQVTSSLWQWAVPNLQPCSAHKTGRRYTQRRSDGSWGGTPVKGEAEKVNHEEPRESKVLWLHQWQWWGSILSEDERKVWQSVEHSFFSSHGWKYSELFILKKKYSLELYYILSTFKLVLFGYNIFWIKIRKKYFICM